MSRIFVDFRTTQGVELWVEAFSVTGVEEIATRGNQAPETKLYCGYFTHVVKGTAKEVRERLEWAGRHPDDIPINSTKPATLQKMKERLKPIMEEQAQETGLVKDRGDIRAEDL